MSLEIELDSEVLDCDEDLESMSIESLIKSSSTMNWQKWEERFTDVELLLLFVECLIDSTSQLLVISPRINSILFLAWSDFNVELFIFFNSSFWVSMSCVLFSTCILSLAFVWFTTLLNSVNISTTSRLNANASSLRYQILMPLMNCQLLDLKIKSSLHVIQCYVFLSTHRAQFRWLFCALAMILMRVSHWLEQTKFSAVRRAGSH